MNKKNQSLLNKDKTQREIMEGEQDKIKELEEIVNQKSKENQQI